MDAFDVHGNHLVHSRLLAVLGQLFVRKHLVGEGMSVSNA